MAQIIEAGLDEISNMLHRVRTHTVQSANGINTAEDRAAITADAAQITDEINRIAKQTTYGGKTVLAGQSVAASIYRRTHAGSNDNT